MGQFPTDYTPVTATGVDADDKFLLDVDSATQYITLAELRKAMAPEIAFTQSIPFDAPVTKLAATSVSGALTFTANTTGAKAGFGAIVELTADGTNTPDFTAFEELSTSGGWDNTNGAVNLCIFLYTGTTYIVTISQVSATSLTQLNAPTGLACADPGETTAAITFTDNNSSPNESGNEFYVYDNVGLTLPLVGTFNTAADANVVNLTGLTAGTDYWVAGVAEGDNITTSNSALSAVFSFTTDAAAGLDADAQAYIDAEELAASIDIDATNENAISALYTAIKAAGAYAKVKRMYLGYGTGLIDGKTLAVATATNPPTISAAGYTFDGTNDVINTGLTPSTDLTDEEGYFLYGKTLGGASVVGSRESGAGTYLFLNSGSDVVYRLSQGGDTTVAGQGGTTARWAVARKADTAVRILKDGASVWNSNSVFATASTKPLAFGASNDDGAPFAPALFVSGIVALLIITDGCSDAEITAIDSAVGTFVSATSRT